ncbi:MAG: alpha/beta hydrolase [Desulfobacteraceae bacterium]|nr:MAG: alpha/beta hydrolase [Desulfobacteraceae bacterium]
MATQKHPLTHAYADVNSVRLHYVANGAGRLILFLHGFPEFWAAWEEQLIEFGRENHAVAPDLRGFNLSSKPADPKQYHIKILVEDLRALVTHLGYQKAILVAHDWGGGIAWAFANRHADMTEKLIIINSPHPIVFARELLHNPLQQKASRYMNLFRSRLAEELLAKNNYAYLRDALTAGSSKWLMSDESRRRYTDAWSQAGALTGGLNYYRISPLHPALSDEERAVLRKIVQAPRELFTVGVPTLVIWGELDEALLTGNLDGLDEFVGQLTIERVPDASHWIVHEQPELINACIRKFID